MSEPGMPLSLVRTDSSGEDHQVSKWDFIQTDPHFRLYYGPSKSPGNGFDFYALEWVSGSCDAGDLWEDPECRVNTVFHGSALYDGVRHLWFGNPDDNGYLYYPSIRTIEAMMRLLGVLEQRHCQQEAL